VVGFACVVLWLGTPNFSASKSYGWLIQVLRFFDPDIDFDTVVWVHGLIRKSAHLFVYAALGLLAFRASWYSFGNLLARVTLTAILVALGVALIDEARQATYDTRTGSPYDVVIDGVGAVCAVGIAALTLHRRLALRRERSTP
jgi:VanZ family protein